MIRLSVSPLRLRLGLFHTKHNEWGKPADPMLQGGIDLTFKPNFFQNGFGWPNYTAQLQHLTLLSSSLGSVLPVGIYRLFSCICWCITKGSKMKKWHLWNQSTEILFAIDQRTVSCSCWCGCLTWWEGSDCTIRMFWFGNKQNLKLPFLLVGMWQYARQGSVSEHMLLFITFFLSSVQMQ